MLTHFKQFLFANRCATCPPCASSICFCRNHDLVERISSTSTQPIRRHRLLIPMVRQIGAVACFQTVRQPFFSTPCYVDKSKPPLPPVSSPRSLIQTCQTCSQLFYHPHAGLSSNDLMRNLSYSSGKIESGDHRTAIAAEFMRRTNCLFVFPKLSEWLHGEIIQASAPQKGQ